MKKNEAFSLAEVTVAIGVIAFALIAILGLIPIGMKSGREAIDATQTSMIAQDAINQIRAKAVSNDPAANNYLGPYPTGSATFYFYTADGARTGELLKVPVTNDQPAFYPNIKNPGDFYRAKISIGLFDQSASYPQYDPRILTTGSTVSSLLCATVEVAWPINPQNGSVVGAAVNKASYTFFLRKQ